MFGRMIGNAIMGAFDRVTPDLGEIYASAQSYRLDDWRLLQQGLVTSSGAATMAMPFAHLVGMAADFAFLMNRLSVCSFGIGAILGEEQGAGNILEAEDFAVVLSRWSDVDGVSNAAVAKVSAGLAKSLGGTEISKMLAKVAAEQAGILANKKLGAKVGTKVAAKLSGKMGTKIIGGMVPFLGPVVGGGVNLWFMIGIADEAESWYRYKLSLGGGNSANGAPVLA